MRYCGRECQRKHRAAHKPLCSQLTLDVANGVFGDMQRVVALNKHNLAEFVVVSNLTGWARSRSVRVLLGNIVQEESTWRKLGEFEHAATAQILIVRSLAMMAVVQCKLADIPPEHRHGAMRYLNEDCAMTVYTGVDENMQKGLELARALARMVGSDTLHAELCDAAVLVETTLAATASQRAVAPPDQYVDVEPNKGRC